MPLFLLPFIDKPLLVLGNAFLSFVIIFGCYSLKTELEKENDNLMEMRKAVLERNLESIKKLYDRFASKKGGKDYTLDFMVYPLCGGVIAILLSLLLGNIK